MTKDLFFIIVFAMNIGAMLFIAMDYLRKTKKSVSKESEDKAGELSASDESDSRKATVGKSKFSIEEARKRAYAAVDDYLESIEEDDVEFDKTPESANNSATLSPEDAKKAFETDERIAKEIADSDNSVAEPMASGVGFDELARAEVILGKKNEPSAEEHKYVVRVFTEFKDTQLMTKIPQALLDKLELCHKKVEAMAAKPAEPAEPVSTPATIKAYAEFSLSDILPKSNH